MKFKYRGCAAWGQASGFTLVELMVTAAVGATLSLTLAQMMVSTNKNAKLAAIPATWAALPSLLATAMSDVTKCGSNFNGLTVSNTSFSGGDIVLTLPSTKPIGSYSGTTLQSTYLQVDKAINNIQATSIQLIASGKSSMASITTSQVPVYLSVVAQKSIDGQLLTQLPAFPTNIVFNLEYNASKKITSCLSGTSSIPSCVAGQIVFANGSTFSCVWQSCPTGWHQTTTSTDLGYLPPATDLHQFDSTTPVDSAGQYKVAVGCAPGSVLGSCGYSGTPTCPSDKSGTISGGCGTGTSPFVLATPQPSAIPSSSLYKASTNGGLVGGVYCSSPSACAGSKTYFYCPLNLSSGWNTPSNANGHTRADCTDNAHGTLAVDPTNSNQWICIVSGTTCPWSPSAGYWGRYNNYSVSIDQTFSGDCGTNCNALLVGYCGSSSCTASGSNGALSNNLKSCTFAQSCCGYNTCTSGGGSAKITATGCI